MRDVVIDIDPKNPPQFPTDKLIDIGGMNIYATRTFTYEDPDAPERLAALPKYKVFWTPPNITALTWPG